MDEAIIPFLHQLRRSTWFARDVGFYVRRLAHANSCLACLVPWEAPPPSLRSGAGVGPMRLVRRLWGRGTGWVQRMLPPSCPGRAPGGDVVRPVAPPERQHDAMDNALAKLQCLGEQLGNRTACTQGSGSIARAPAIICRGSDRMPKNSTVSQGKPQGAVLRRHG